MLSLSQVEVIAGYPTQALQGALVWQRQFGNFNGKLVIEDLASCCDLWSSFVFTRPVYTADLTGLGIINQVDLLLDLAQRPLSSSNSYVADTLYLLAKGNSSTVSTLLSLGEKWQADSIEIIDGRQTRNQERLNRQLARRLRRSNVDAVVICYWWDRS